MTEVQRLRRELQQLSERLHEREAVVIQANEKASGLELSLREHDDVMDRKTAELQVRCSEKKVNIQRP